MIATIYRALSDGICSINNTLNIIANNSILTKFWIAFCVSIMSISIDQNGSMMLPNMRSSATASVMSFPATDTFMFDKSPNFELFVITR